MKTQSIYVDLLKGFFQPFVGQITELERERETYLFESLLGRISCLHNRLPLVAYCSCNDKILHYLPYYEQFTIEDSPELFDFYDEINTKIIEKHKTINKTVGGKNIRDILDSVEG